MIGIGIAVGGVMMATTALASGLGSNGYDVYKDAFNNTRSVTSMTGTAAITVSDNGNPILRSNDSIKLNRNTQDMSGSFNLTAGNEIKSCLVYRENGQTITKDSDSEIYNVLALQPDKVSGKREQTQNNPAAAKDVQNIFNLIAGNFQNYISLNNQANGDKQVSLELSGSQVPALANAVVSLAVDRGMQNMEKSHNPANSAKTALAVQMPKLVSDIALAKVDVVADINSQNLIKEQTANLTVTGKDAAGNSHTLNFSIDVNLFNFNSTTPDKVDLTGKQVKTIQAKTVERFGHHS